MTTSLALVAVTGSRTWPHPQRLEDTLLDVWHDALQDGHTGIRLIHGDAEGADTIADRWARRHGIPIDPKPADWTGPCAPDCPPGHRRRNRRGLDYCPLAGHRRNQLLIDARPLLLVAAHHNSSTGTADCIRRAEKAEVPVWRVRA